MCYHGSMNRKSVVSVILVAMFTALMAAGSFIRVPLPPVPVTLHTLFIMLCGILLPLSLSLPSVLLYLFLGLIGLPVFTGGGGFAALAGPTGGYIAGYIPAVIVLGLLRPACRKCNCVFLFAAACLLSQICIYVPGLLWLRHSLSLSTQAALAAGLVPFIIGDIVKTAVAAVAGKALLPRVDGFFREDAE